MPFALPEYEAAAQRQAWLAISALAIASSELLQQVTIETAEEIPTSVVSGADGRVLEIPSAPVSFRFVLDPTRIAAGELGDVLSELSAAAQVKANELERHMIETLSSVSDFVGNVTDAKGGPLTLDVLTEAMTNMDIAFDDEGNPVHLTLLMHPDQVASALPATEEQQARHAAMIDRKRAEWEAKKRKRRLGSPPNESDA